MSREDLEIATRALQAAIARPQPDYATVNELYAPDHVFAPAGAESGIEEEAQGAEGFRRWRETTQQILSPEHELEGVVDVGGGKVLVVTTTRFKVQRTDTESEQRIWTVVTIKNGKIVRTEAYTDPARALEAAQPD